MDIYFGDYAADFPGLRSAAWGFTIDTATQAVRMVLSGVFEAYPDLKIIVGHLGESVPFSLWRINDGLNRPGNKGIAFRDIFCRNFWITTSGNFSTPALMCCLMEMGVERILFSVDYPFVENDPGTKWMANLPLGAEDRQKILNGNATRVLKLA
jgi:2,3-dihydroxybenzoate decarboxylase